jgi:HK97 family phage major capsid protein
MRKKLKEIREQMAKLLADMRAINDKALEEKREFTTDETESYEKMEADYDSLEAKAERLKKMIEREDRAMLNGKTDPIDPADPKDPPAGGDGDPASDEGLEMRVFNTFLTSGTLGMFSPEEQRALRALQADSDIYGGYLVAPQKFITKLIKDIDNSVIIRQYATGHTLKKAASMGAPSLDTDIDDADWTAEVKTGSEDSSMALGHRELNPHPLAKRIKVSETLLRISAINAETLVRDRMAYKHAITREKAYMTGTGAQQPLGLFTASADGISTGQDVSTGNTTTSIKTDGLIEALYTLKEGFQRRARWIFHRDGIKQIRKLKDGDGQYIWQPGIKGDRPNTILDRPYHMSEYAPNTFTTGKYVGIIGDLSYYWYVDILSMRIQRLNELYAETNQVGFIGRWEGDGMPVLENAFARVTLA